MPDRFDDTEPVLGRNLVETAMLNSREHRAGRQAAAAIRLPPQPRSRRGLLRGWVWLAAAVAAVGLAALTMELAGLP